MTTDPESVRPFDPGIVQADKSDFATAGGYEKTLTISKPPARIPGFTSFTLGAVYAICRLNKDLLSEFMAQGEKLPAINLFHDSSVFLGSGDWDNILQAIPDSAYEKFEPYLTNYVLTHTPTRRYFHIRQVWVPFPDTNTKIVTKPGSETHASVFLPSGNTFRVGVVPRPGYLGEYVRRPVEQEVVAMAKVFFEEIS